jgi:hypothetical protein
LESLRKQAKKLARDIAAGDADAVARAHAQLPDSEPPLSQRDAQLVLAREYGFAGWQNLREEVLKRAGNGLEWVARQAERAIHDNDLERLKEWLADYPALLAWRGDDGATLLSAAAASFGDSGDPIREQTFTRPAAAELLVDAGAVVDPDLWKGIVNTRAIGMLQLLWRKGVLARTPTILAALGDLDGVRACFDASGRLRIVERGPVEVSAVEGSAVEDAAAEGGDDERAVVDKAFMAACRFKQKEVAAFLLDRCIALDNELDARIAGWRGRAAFIDYLGDHPQNFGGPWRTLVVNEVMRTIHEDDLTTFTRLLESEPHLLQEAGLGVQVEIIECATLNDRGSFIRRLFDLDPAILHHPTPPSSSAVIFALEYGKAHLISELTRIWPLPDDLPHAAGLGDLERVKRWFDDAGQPALGELGHHHPVNNPFVRGNLHWGAGTVQQVLDVSLAWACMNKRLDVAAFLVAHGANVNTDWSTHEPASIMHECAMHGNYESAGFLIEHGIDLTIRDYRWNATAEGWAYHAAKDEKMASLLATAARRRTEE